MSFSTWFGGLSFALLAAVFVTGVAGQGVVRVPSGEPIVVDGVVADAEWAGSVDVGTGALRVALLTSGEYLQIGLRTPAVFVASLCIARDNEVQIFHASSAVGHGIYRRAADEWVLSQPFEWRLRGIDGAPAPGGEQAEHLERYGWLANTVSTGTPGHTEFQISNRLLGASPPRIALGLLLEGEAPAVQGWPMAAELDGCTQRSTIAGPLPDTMSFDPTTWVRLEIGQR